MIARLLYRTGALSGSYGWGFHYQAAISRALRDREVLEQEQRRKQEELEAVAAQIAGEDAEQAAEQVEAERLRRQIARLKEQSRIALARIKALQAEEVQRQSEITRQEDEIARVLMLFMLEM